MVMLEEAILVLVVAIVGFVMTIMRKVYATDRCVVKLRTAFLSVHPETKPLLED